MSDSFGAQLRQQRERQQIALSAIAEQTKIKLSLLEGLERDDVSQWPSGIFRRAFIRTYAHAIGLEPDDVVHTFLSRYPDAADDCVPVPAVPPEADGVSPSHGPPTRLRYLVGSAIDSLGRLRRDAVQPTRPVAAERERTDTRSVAAERERTDARPVAAERERTDTRSIAAERERTGTRPVVAEQSGTDTGSVAAEQSETDSPSVAAERALSSTPPVAPAVAFEPDLMAAARVCTELAQVADLRGAAPLLRDMADSLGAAGLIFWLWHPHAGELRPALAHGYSEQLLGQLPKLARGAGNATATAFRSGQTCVVEGRDLASGALVAPVVTSVGCVGVLAIELRDGRERQESVRALTTMFAAQLSRVVGTAEPADAAGRRLA
jgi:cytoskeletal protein RodZ